MYSKSVQGPWSGITILEVHFLHLAIKLSVNFRKDLKLKNKSISI